MLATAQFMVVMDTSIIGVALPDMQRELGFSQSGLQWVFNAYVVALGGLLLGGKLSDLFGARRVFAAGWLVLIGGSVVAAAATGAEARGCRARPGHAADPRGSGKGGRAGEGEDPGMIGCGETAARVTDLGGGPVPEQTSGQPSVRTRPLPMPRARETAVAK